MTKETGMTKEKLLPCPQCDCVEPHNQTSEHDFDLGWKGKIKCPDCGYEVYGNSFFQGRRAEELARAEAFAAWNTRTPEPAPAGEIERIADHIEQLVEALRPLASVPLVYPRKGSQPQVAQLEPNDKGPYIAADVVRARQLIETLTGFKYRRPLP